MLWLKNLMVNKLILIFVYSIYIYLIFLLFFFKYINLIKREIGVSIEWCLNCIYFCEKYSKMCLVIVIMGFIINLLNLYNVLK